MPHSDAFGGHVTAGLNLGPLLDKVRPTSEDRIRFIKKAMSVDVDRPTEGLTVRVLVPDTNQARRR